MICKIGETPVYYEEYGEGTPIVCIHGYFVDHRLMSGCLEPVFEAVGGYRRIYLDMPGFGKTPADYGIKNADDMLALLIRFIGRVIGEEHFLLIGESFGGYLCMGLIGEMPENIDGVMLICPSTVFDHDDLPEKKIVYCSKEFADSEDSDAASFLDMAVMATSEGFGKYKRDILSGIRISDKKYLTRYFKGKFRSDHIKQLREIKYEKPTCILTGRQDHVVGYSAAYEMLAQFPRASLLIADCAGHNLQIDNEPLFGAMTSDWIRRVELSQSDDSERQ